jgi:hypothetical protein
LVTAFIEHLQNVTTNNYDSLTELHTPKIIATAARIKSSVFTSHYLVAASNSGRSPSSEFPECLQPPAHAVSSLADFYTLKTEAIRPSETSVYIRSTRRHIPKDGILHSHQRKNFNNCI